MAYKLGFLILPISLLAAAIPTWASSKSIITAEADVDVSEAAPNRKHEPRFLLKTGIGRGAREGRLISYLRFDLSDIPDSTLVSQVSIDSAQLRLLAPSFGLASQEERFFVTVSSCSEIAWLESDVTWNSRPCKDTREGEDSTIVDGENLPEVHTWDVSRSVAQAKAGGASKITFVVEAFLLRYSSREIVPGALFGPEERVGFVRFWPREREEFGVNAVPTLAISHSSAPTALLDFLSILIAFLSALGVAAGLYEGFAKFRGRKPIHAR